MGSYAKLPRRQDVLFPIVDEEQCFRRKTRCRNGVLEDPGVGLQRADLIRKDVMVEVIHDSIRRTDELDMSLVRVGNENQRILPLERGDQLLRNDQVREENR